jgi:hypothetical protein
MLCIGYKVKVKLSLYFNWAPRHEDVLRSGGIASHILWPRHYMEVNGQLHDPAALTLRKEPPLPTGKEKTIRFETDIEHIKRNERNR